MVRSFGERPLAQRESSVGEVVFNTSITGYQEIISDPSYARQIVTLTYPHIGNVGVNSEDVESTGIFASGLVVRDVPSRISNWRAEKSLTEYLAEYKVVGIADIDTRKLTRILRDKGAQRGCIVAGMKAIDEAPVRWIRLRAFRDCKAWIWPKKYRWPPPICGRKRNGGWSLAMANRFCPVSM